MSEDSIKELQSRLRAEYEALFTLKEDNGLEIYPIFNVLPPKKEYPDYYALIRNPVSLNTLKKRVPHYTDAQTFVNDVVQIPWNAKTYNTKESAIYRYAGILEKYLKEKMVPRLQEHYPEVEYPYLGPLPDEIEGQKLHGVTPRVPPPARPRATRLKTEDDEGNNNDDEDYSEEKRSLPQLRLTLHRGMQSASQSYQGGRSHSSTPKPLYGRHQQQRTHMRRGRPPVIDLPYVQRIKNVLKMLKKEIDDDNEALTLTFERLPDELREPRYYTVISNPVCLEDIRKRVKTRKYKDFQTFQNDFQLMLTNYRLYHRTEPQALKKAAILEKKYNALVRHELSKPDRDYMPEGELRYPMDEVEVNGNTYKIGDWVLLENPNDATKPTVAQIFRLWSTSDGRKWLNACWYLRPEQTVHRVDRLFYKNEVVKSGQYRDHLVEELVGKCYVVHFTRYQRGDPDIKLDGPLFVCEFRYNENDKIFNKIRTWKACLPEEIRDQDENTISVNGRKFLKYPSPLKNLLPPNAAYNDPMPQPTEGAVNAPPLIGAVYMRPKLERDDLGEYSTSDDCPRYIVRPGDPPEEGRIDFDTGTIITNTQTATALPKTGQSSARLATLKQNRSGSGLNSLRNGMYTPPLGINGPATGDSLGSSSPKMATPNGLIPGQQLTVQGLKQHQLNKQQLQFQQQQQHKRSQASGYNLTTIVNNLAAQASRNTMGHISVDSPSAYVLPVSITKNVDVLQRTDYASQVRRLGKEQVPRKKRNKGEVLWFKGPSVAIEERLLNSGDERLQPSLNRWFSKNANKRPKLDLDYEVVEEPAGKPQEEETADSIGYNHNSNGPLEDDDDSSYSEDDSDDENEQETLQDSYPLGLRPSARFMAYKLSTRDKLSAEST
ncbi:BN860_15742g1_1 [Zygosaccharomyces bailii CLIB 213]|uniref:BN860_15742g1_1 n=1 Tax=Zygosaccharomyces bailii (strain CLIB 213 / ATCC 58445 / CBS 680 / BCRC 21525 / NBRC 1098 / NCYC 1416 / NRRL Y-2227) TaxID=1333698 RepID=A0A8J2X6E7_ZYGB2|nr:BN860_15742g1_1 [Zygosaccharomyces bailii CLIB 213]